MEEAEGHGMESSQCSKSKATTVLLQDGPSSALGHRGGRACTRAEVEASLKRWNREDNSWTWEEQGGSRRWRGRAGRWAWQQRGAPWETGARQHWSTRPGDPIQEPSVGGGREENVLRRYAHGAAAERASWWPARRKQGACWRAEQEGAGTRAWSELGEDARGGTRREGERGAEDRERRGDRGKKLARVEGDKHREKISREWGRGQIFLFFAVRDDEDRLQR
ncbi:hypothetical protein ZEAMMB73_Zm00001d046191 [Zea mays]|jgi:hypothetical protein|uniref:Uncharacterized protein n=1 Tax=Zea mays TaxID=4577 RepID=K7W957_MAIZE|nr:hypothetical protein ZEAMMB73_Zm00001d046191 [Zea mays]